MRISFARHQEKSRDLMEFHVVGMICISVVVSWYTIEIIDGFVDQAASRTFRCELGFVVAPARVEAVCRLTQLLRTK